MNIEEDRFKREREIADAWTKAGYDVSRPDDYEIMLKSLQANLISVRDQRDNANAQLRRAKKTLARLAKRNIELRLELDVAETTCKARLDWTKEREP